MAMTTDVLNARVLIYSATAGYRHASIPAAINALRRKAEAIHVDFDDTEDRDMFRDEILTQYDAVLFLSNSEEVLDNPGKAALQRYFDRGGNFVGIHSASACLFTTEFFQKQLGAHFEYHPEPLHAIMDVIEPEHPSTRVLPARWPVFDEIYSFRSDPRSVGATVVLAVDESSYTDIGTRKFDHGTPHPIAWFQEKAAGVSEGGTPGRSFYTALGHTDEIWTDELFLSHVLGGIAWVLESPTARTRRVAVPMGI